MLAIATYFIFAKQLPFTSHYTVKAIMQNSNLLVPGSPVRIATVTSLRLCSRAPETIS